MFFLCFSIVVARAYQTTTVTAAKTFDHDHSSSSSGNDSSGMRSGDITFHPTRGPASGGSSILVSIPHVPINGHDLNANGRSSDSNSARGSVRGSNNEYTCYFGTIAVRGRWMNPNPLEIECIAPPYVHTKCEENHQELMVNSQDGICRGHGRVPLTIVMTDGRHAESKALKTNVNVNANANNNLRLTSSMEYEYYKDPIIASFVPRIGPAIGGVNIIITLEPSEIENSCININSDGNEADNDDDELVCRILMPTSTSWE